MESIAKKRAASRRMNVIKRAMIIQSIVAEMYEPGNQSKSKSQAYRQQISRVHPMGERTFWRIMAMNTKKELEIAVRQMQDAQYGQMMLQFD